MRDMPEAEARAHLVSELLCQDAGEWQYLRQPRGTARLQCGLLNSDGMRTGLHVNLLFSRSPSTRLPRYVFSVFHQTVSTTARVYQLHVEQLPRMPKHQHAMAHEHFGDARTVGAPDWLKWSYREVLAHFCKHANVRFEPPPGDPEDFQLVG